MSHKILVSPLKTGLFSFVISSIKISERPKEVHKQFSLISFVLHRVKRFRKLFHKRFIFSQWIILTLFWLDEFIKYTEPAEAILRYFRNKHLCTTRYWLFIYTLVAAREKRTKRTVASEEKINLFRNLKWVINHWNWIISWGTIIGFWLIRVFLLLRNWSLVCRPY